MMEVNSTGTKSAASAGNGQRAGRRAQGDSQEKSFLRELSDAEDMMQLIRERKQEICDKVRRGDTEVKIRIGAQEYTPKQWKKLLERFDETEDDIREKLAQAREQQRRAGAQSAALPEDGGQASRESLIEKLLADREEEKLLT